MLIPERPHPPAIGSLATARPRHRLISCPTSRCEQNSQIGAGPALDRQQSIIAPNGRYRESHDRRAVTIGNEAPVRPSPTPRTATATSSATSPSDQRDHARLGPGDTLILLNRVYLVAASLPTLQSARSSSSDTSKELRKFSYREQDPLFPGRHRMPSLSGLIRQAGYTKITPAHPEDQIRHPAALAILARNSLMTRSKDLTGGHPACRDETGISAPLPQVSPA